MPTQKLLDSFQGTEGLLTNGFLFLLLLGCVLFTLTFAAIEALGSMSLVDKARPATKIFAALAPLDFHVAAVDDPNTHIAEGTQPLVLSGDKSHFRVGLGTHAGFSALDGGGCGAALSTHDAATETFRQGKGWEVHETHKFWHNFVLICFNITI